LEIKIVMRAVVVREFGGIENASLGDMPKPAPKAGEVLLEVHAVSVNFVDLVMMSGSYQFKPALPFIPGKLPVGVVAAVGDGVTRFKPGDHALLMAEQGGFAEFAVMPESQCVKLPEALPFTEAAAMALIYDTAYFALKDRGRIEPGETVLVLGATGGVGLAAIQLAKAMGGRVLAAVASKDKEDIVRAAGADAVIDLSAPDLHESLRAQVFAQTDKRGADIILDMLGGDIFDAAVRALAWRGRLVVIGFAPAASRR
jgi:NADPH2:quinone reductase